jgi:hypothetical protein
MAQVKISKMEQVTLAAIDSANPFNTPTSAPRSLDGKPIKQEKPHDPKEPEPPPMKEEEPEPELIDSLNSRVLENAPPIPKFDIPSDPEPSNPIIQTRSSEGLPSYRCEFAGRDIFVAWPWYKFSNPVTASCQVALALDFGRDKIRFDMSIGDSKIEHARNRLAHKFLETDAKWMLMIDDDIIPCIGRPAWMRHWVHAARELQDLPLQRHIIHRLIGANKTLVGGAYFGRQEGGAIMCSDLSLATRAKAYEDAIVQVEWVATGCMLIHRKVFTDIRAKFGDSLKIDVPDYEYDYFRPFDSKGGEDIAFCKRAKEAGHDAHIDLGTPIFHVGFKTY